MVLTDRPTKARGTVAYTGATSVGTAINVESGAMRRQSSGQARADARNVESAVFAHIQALRALGKTKVNTADIAKALGLRTDLVDRTVSELRNKGVKLAK